MATAAFAARDRTLADRPSANTDGLGGKAEHLTGGRLMRALPKLAFEHTLNNLVVSGYLVPDE